MVPTTDVILLQSFCFCLAKPKSAAKCTGSEIQVNGVPLALASASVQFYLESNKVMSEKFQCTRKIGCVMQHE